MEKIVGDWDTLVKMSVEEATKVCRLGQMDGCCAFLVMGSEGFECVRMVSAFSVQLCERLRKGTMNAKGEGGWEGCAWEGKLS